MERTTIRQRHLCYTRHQDGETYATIAAHLGVSPMCVRYWSRQQRDGRTVLDTRYQRPSGRLLERFPFLVRYAILRFRLRHPGWGRNRIQYALSQHPALQGEPVPSATQIGRYLHQWPRFRRRRGLHTRGDRPMVPRHVHECWQLDFKLGIALTAGRRVNLYTIRDPVGAACIAACVVEAGRSGEVAASITLPQTRHVLRQAFAQWATLPDAIQTDHQTGLAATEQHDFPALFTLWLVGLHIEHRFIRPGYPTDNAEVERCHRTLMDYAIRGNEHLAIAALQQTMDRAVHPLNWELPSQAHGCHGHPPVTAHPELLQPRRPFQADLEFARFDRGAVDTYLARFAWERTASKVGQVVLGGHSYSVGRPWARARITIRFVPATRAFVFFQGETEIRRHPAKGLDVATLLGMDSPHEAPGPQQLCFAWPE